MTRAFSVTRQVPFGVLSTFPGFVFSILLGLDERLAMISQSTRYVLYLFNIFSIMPQFSFTRNVPVVAFSSDNKIS